MRLKRLTLSLLLLPLCGCMGQSVSQSAAGPAATPPVVSADRPVQRRLLIKLTLSAPQDLKVQQGDAVQAGQVIADRVRDRTRLEFQKQQLQVQIQKLQAMQAQAAPDMAGLPAPSFLSEVAEMERLKLKAVDAQRFKEQQQRKLDLLSTLPQGEVPEAVIPHETEVLQQKERAVDQAEAEVDLAQGKLAQAQTNRVYQEYQHSLELSKRAIALRQQEIEQQSQLAQLGSKLSELELQLSTLSAVRSPYSGKIQRIKITGQTDQTLTVELVLVLSDHQSGTGRAEAVSGHRLSPSFQSRPSHSE